jgi:4-hydroxy-3-methylbut-2-enyl diphosphate reductase
VVNLIRDHRLDLMLVIGGYNSSNTCNLARICAGGLPTFHVADAECVVSADEIRHLPVGGSAETATRGWLRAEGAVAVGLTAGASTPDVIVGQVIERLGRFANPGRPR